MYHNFVSSQTSSSERFGMRLLTAVWTLFSISVLGQAVTATWSSGSGNWTTVIQWSYRPGPATCVPNNYGAQNNLYTVVLNSPNNTLTLDSTSNPTSVTVNSVNVQAGTLRPGPGATLTVNNNFTNNDTLIDERRQLVSRQVADECEPHPRLRNYLRRRVAYEHTGRVTVTGGALGLSGITLTNLSGGWRWNGKQKRKFLAKMPTQMKDTRLPSILRSSLVDGIY